MSSILVTASVASAQVTRVTLTEPRGRNASAFTRELSAELEARGLTVSVSDGSPRSTEETASVASETGADAVLGGRVAARGRGWIVRLWVRDAMGGDQGEVRLRVRRRSQFERVVDAVVEALELVPVAAPPEPEVVDEPPPEPEAAPEPEPQPPAPEPPSEDADGADADWISGTLLVGVGMRGRSFQLLSPDGVDAGYRAEPYLELSVRGSVRILDIFFARLLFGSSLELVSDREGPALEPVRSWFSNLQADLGGSYRIGGWVEVGAAVGLRWDRYQMTFNELVPTAEYLGIRPALLTGVKLVEDWLAFQLEVGARIPFTVGDLTALHGIEWSAWALDLVARFHGVIEPGLTWNLEGGGHRYDLRFERTDGIASGGDAEWFARLQLGWTL